MSNTKIAFIGDLHFDTKNYRQLSQALALAVDICIMEEVDTVVQLGDIYHHYNISTGQTSVATIVCAVKDQFRRLLSKNIDVIIVEGNHDKSIKGIQGESHRSSIDLLHEVRTTNNVVSGIYPITNASLVKLREEDTYAFICLPWETDDERSSTIKELAEDFNNTFVQDFKILIGHFFLEGVTYRGNEITPEGFTLTQEQLNSFDHHLSAAGHIHERQLIYPGILMHHSLHDAGSPNGIRIVTFDTTSKKILEDKFVDIKAPKFISKDCYSSTVGEIEAFLVDLNPNDYDKYVIKIHGEKKGDPKKPKNVELRYIPPSRNVKRVSIDKNKMEKLSRLEKFKVWVDMNKHFTQDSIDEAIKILKESGIT